MKNIWLVLKREYLVRVRKKSFIVMTILAPLLMAAFYAVIIFIAVKSDGGDKKISVIDETGSFATVLKNDDGLKYSFTTESLDKAKEKLKGGKADLLVWIPKNIVVDPKGVRMFAEKNISLELKSDIENQIETEVENRRLKDAGIDIKIIESTKANVRASTFIVSDEGDKSSNSVVATIVAYACALLIYITLLVYGSQIMRSVMEEKTNRIIEVIISSVKPFQLLMGKILGVGMVGLTQFALWIILGTALSTAGTSLVVSQIDTKQTEQVMKQAQKMNTSSTMDQSKAQPQNEVAEMMKVLSNSMTLSQVLLILGCFLFYFLGGYLIYGALFGAVGAAVDSETETQQFMMPIMLPIIASIALSSPVLNDPNGSLAFWTSMIPFTSPVLMMIRLPFGVPTWELVLSMTLLVLGFVGTIWLASRIYRIGILMYGKKVNFKELSKWIFYKG
jgi:ABC-2 type transport system permease protein